MNSHDMYGGKYTSEEITRIENINSRPIGTKRFINAFYKKSAGENGPTLE